ncbi:DUF402 domain-containing protein [Tsukamurella sp. 8F]|nr:MULTISPECIES: DUF402 domain-containing protein [unclassified Tsukamurella]MDF0528694.1 DUF402 domain-containing protein [Tsukamurella sp. 8J]MDF0585656.1 DUF402 domain-containing protein [Tsukamurella sp. 8F]
MVKRLTVDATVDDAALHPPKRESFDTAATVNIDPKGVARPVDEFRDEPFGLYMARPADHPQFDYLESWLLPRMHLRATRFRFTPGHERDQRVYLDVARVWREGAVWHTEDWYLDLVEHPGRPIELVDVDELLEAAAAGLVSITDAETAIRVAAEASSGITLHGHSVDAWLAASGAPVAWHS